MENRYDNVIANIFGFALLSNDFYNTGYVKALCQKTNVIIAIVKEDTSTINILLVHYHIFQQDIL